ncbi:MAG: hypothetical protein PHI59_01280 [Candidatus Omnitrophica bacterium]|nr:hypothetical protein [Candidatus Omnitrophota bacterium]
MPNKPILQFAILCDDVSIENGKYAFNGLFEQINSTGFPAVHKKAMIATRWGNGQGTGFKQHIIIRNEATKEVIFSSEKLEGTFSLYNTKSTHTIIGSIGGLLFKGECDCVVEIYLNGRKEDIELYFRVVRVKDPVGNRIAHYFQRRAEVAGH